MIFVDLAGSMHEDGLSCPPSVFVTPNVLQSMRDSLKPDGRFIFKLKIDFQALKKIDSKN